MESTEGAEVEYAESTTSVDSLKRKAPEQESEEQAEEQEEEVTAAKKQKGGEGEKEGSEEQSNEAKEEREWFYIDDNKKEQGPFTLQEMKSWWFGGYMPATLTVRKSDEKDFVSITTLSEFQQVPYTDPSAYYAYYYQNAAMASSAAGATTAATTDTTAQAAYPGEQQIFPTYVFTPPVDKSEDDRIAAQLLCSDYSQTAAFNKRTGRFSSADGAWTDSASRQMAHYFDYEAWQRTCQENAAKKVKRVCPRHMWKQYRKKKKIPDYLRD